MLSANPGTTRHRITVPGPGQPAPVTLHFACDGDARVETTHLKDDEGDHNTFFRCVSSTQMPAHGNPSSEGAAGIQVDETATGRTPFITLVGGAMNTEGYGGGIWDLDAAYEYALSAKSETKGAIQSESFQVCRRGTDECVLFTNKTGKPVKTMCGNDKTTIPPWTKCAFSDEQCCGQVPKLTLSATKLGQFDGRGVDDYYFLQTATGSVLHASGCKKHASGDLDCPLPESGENVHLCVAGEQPTSSSPISLMAGTDTNAIVQPGTRVRCSQTALVQGSRMACGDPGVNAYVDINLPNQEVRIQQDEHTPVLYVECGGGSPAQDFVHDGHDYYCGSKPDAAAGCVALASGVNKGFSHTEIAKFACKNGKWSKGAADNTWNCKF